MISVVCVYNNQDIYERALLKSLRDQTAKFELVALENRGREFTSAAKAYNQGGAKAKGDYVMFVHQDMWLASKRWLEEAEHIANTLPTLGVAGVVGMVQPKHGIPARAIGSIGFISESTALDTGGVQSPEEVQTLDECLLLVPRTVFDKLKFDEATFDGWDCYGADYCLSAKDQGLKAYVIPVPSHHCCVRAALPKWELQNLLKYQKRLYKKHRRRYKVIHTWLGRVSRLTLFGKTLMQSAGPSLLRIRPNTLAFVRSELEGCETVLDLGCGYRSPLQGHRVAFSVGVEAFDPFLQLSRMTAIHSQYILADIRSVAFKPKSFDAVIASEVLEHLTKDEGRMVLARMEEWARKKVLVTTPNGYLKQKSYETNPLQEHKSGWTAGELSGLGFRVRGGAGWKRLKGERFAVRYRPAFLWERISDLTHFAVYRWPDHAYQLMAVKRLDADGQSQAGA